MAQVVEVLVEGGKASPGPPLGPAIGPLGLNVKQVVDEINKATKEFEGMQVPVKIIVEDPKKKTFRIEVGIPPTSQLIKKELGIPKLKRSRPHSGGQPYNGAGHQDSQDEDRPDARTEP